MNEMKNDGYALCVVDYGLGNNEGWVENDYGLIGVVMVGLCNLKWFAMNQLLTETLMRMTMRFYKLK